VGDALITDQEISLLCDVLEGRGADLNADKTVRPVFERVFPYNGMGLTPDVSTSPCGL